MKRFHESLQMGKTGESYIARWLEGQGFSVLPVYEKVDMDYKGPVMRVGGESLVLPDMLAFRFVDNKHRQAMWFEAKHKSHFSWYAKGRCFVTGIDLHHYQDYCKVHDGTPFPVYLLFYHPDPNTWEEDVRKWGAPRRCPVGLFGERLDILRDRESHRHENWGKHGMVYWDVKNLRLLQKLDTPSTMAAD